MTEKKRKKKKSYSESPVFVNPNSITIVHKKLILFLTRIALTAVTQRMTRFVFCTCTLGESFGNGRYRWSGQLNLWADSETLKPSTYGGLPRTVRLIYDSAAIYIFFKHTHILFLTRSKNVNLCVRSAGRLASRPIVRHTAKTLMLQFSRMV